MELTNQRRAENARMHILAVSWGHMDALVAICIMNTILNFFQSLIFANKLILLNTTQYTEVKFRSLKEYRSS